MSDLKKKDEELEDQEEKPLTDKEWDDIDPENESTGGEEAKKEDTTTEEDAEKEGDKGLPPGAPDPEGVSSTHGSVESVEKALADTKKHATEVSMENAELRKKVKEFEEGKATEAEVAAAKASFDEAKGGLAEAKKKVEVLAEDFPELKDVLEPMLKLNASLVDEVADLKKGVGVEEAERARQKEYGEVKANFDANIAPVVAETHPDFLKIFLDPDRTFFKWAEVQSPGIKKMAMESDNPQDITYALTEYKKAIASGDVKTAIETEAKNRNDKLNNAHALRGGSSGGPPSQAPDDKDNYEAGWAIKDPAG